MHTFADLLTELSRQGIRYMLVGGLAVELCGYSRVTQDVDILIEYAPHNIENLLACLAKFGEGSARELDVADFDLEEGCIRIVEDFPLDVFTVMNGHSYQDLLPYLKTERLRGAEISYLGIDGLLKLKQDSLRPKDQLDVHVLQDLKRKETL